MTGPVGRVVAAVDCGTNSTRLLVSRDGVDTLERRTIVTCLGQGVDASGFLDREAIGRTVAVLEDYRRIMDGLGVEAVRATATSAARDARNAEEFFAAAAAVLGTRPELLDGDTEGRLGFAGATAGLDPNSGPFLVADIGGGSTEFAFGADRCEGVLSADVGCVRLTEQYIRHDPPRPEELHACLSVTEAHLEDVLIAIPDVHRTARFIGVSGTVTSAAAVELGLEPYDPDRIHHFELTRAAAEDVFRTLATEDHDQRISNPGLHADRADVIVAGMCVLVKIMRFFGFDTCLVSETDLLDGLVQSLLAGEQESSSCGRGQRGTDDAG
ncbi:MAG: Ppx/GppA phosphatase family protein [bacterium]|nr:Ppx/GppA phosphatase family protein [bacterium]